MRGVLCSVLVASACLDLGSHARPCGGRLEAVYADMHDGDQKNVKTEGTSLTIVPYGNNQTWKVQAVLDLTFCNASIDFNVPGKPNPPPVKLSATIYWSGAVAPGGTEMRGRTELAFTDPSATLAAPDFPLNRWIQVAHPWHGRPLMHCPEHLQAVYADMHDGDQKHVTISGSSLTIAPYGNKQTWRADAVLDRTFCNASIDFNVPGKPNPPPVPLTATMWWSGPMAFAGPMQRKAEWEFTDPSAKLGAPDFPLNHWVELTRDRPTLNAPMV